MRLQDEASSLCKNAGVALQVSLDFGLECVLVIAKRFEPPEDLGPLGSWCFAGFVNQPCNLLSE